MPLLHMIDLQLVLVFLHGVSCEILYLGAHRVQIVYPNDLLYPFVIILFRVFRNVDNSQVLSSQVIFLFKVAEHSLRMLDRFIILMMKVSTR